MPQTDVPISPAKRKRLLKTYGSCPAGYTSQELEQFLDLLYGMFSYRYTMVDLRHLSVSDLFDRSEIPRQLTLAKWLEALLT